MQQTHWPCCGALNCVFTGQTMPFCGLCACRCQAFTFESATGCGFLKSSPATSKRMGWVAFVR
jgi:hypothetical protein